MEKLYTSAEVALILGVNQRTVRRWVKDGKVVPAVVLPGGAARFEQSEINRAFFKGRTVPERTEGEP